MNTNIKIELQNDTLQISFNTSDTKGFIEFADDIRTYLKQKIKIIKIDLSKEDTIDSLIVGKMIKMIKISREFEKEIIFKVSTQVEKIIKLTSLDNIISYEIENNELNNTNSYK